MSLNRVASLETFLSAAHTDDGRPVRQTRERRDSASSCAASERARKLSFNPLPESWDPAFTRDDDVPNPAVGAFEVPQWKRIRKFPLPSPHGAPATKAYQFSSLTTPVVQISVTVVYCLFAAGIVFGYAAIKPVLKREGAYQDV